MIDLEAHRTTALNDAKSILAAAKSGNRELTDAEQATMTGHLARIKELDKQIKGRALVNSVMSLGSSEDHLDGRGGIFTDAAKAGIVQAVKTRTAYRTELDLGGTKAALTSGTLLPTSGTGVEGGLHPNSQFPLASLFANQPASGPSQRYYRTTAGTAAVVAEASLKPDAGVTFVPVDAVLSKLACTAQFSSEMEEDAPFLISYLQQDSSPRSSPRRTSSSSTLSRPPPASSSPPARAPRSWTWPRTRSAPGGDQRFHAVRDRGPPERHRDNPEGQGRHRGLLPRGPAVGLALDAARRAAGLHSGGAARERVGGLRGRDHHLPARPGHR